MGALAEVIATAGLELPDDLRPEQFFVRGGGNGISSGDLTFTRLEAGELVSGASSPLYARYWAHAQADSLLRPSTHKELLKIVMLCRACAVVLVGVALAFYSGLVHAADPQPYEVSIAKTGEAELDKAIADSSLLVSLREKAPVGPFALVGRAREDEDRFLTVLNGLGFYKGQVDVLIGGRIP